MPQRFLKPGITNSSRWNRVSFKAQSLYVRLLTLVDDFGRYDGRPSVIWGYCFAIWNEEHPNDAVSPQETAALCQQLAAEDLIEIYEADGKKVVQITQWTERARSTTSKWPKNKGNSKVDSNPLPNPAESCEILPPSSPPSPSPSSPSSSSPARAPSEDGSGTRAPFAEIPSWNEFWGYCQTQACLLPAEWYAKDKFEAANADQWKNKSDWRAYARRCKGWWENDGRPMVPKSNQSGGFRNGKPQIKPDHEKGF
jgi:hypothetical protein